MQYQYKGNEISKKNKKEKKVKDSDAEEENDDKKRDSEPGTPLLEKGKNSSTVDEDR